MSAHGLDHSLTPEHQVIGRTKLVAGNKAIYPGQGPCLIGRVVRRVVDGRGILFYHFTVLDDSGVELFIPVEKAQVTAIVNHPDFSPGFCKGKGPLFQSPTHG